MEPVFTAAAFFLRASVVWLQEKNNLGAPFFVEVQFLKAFVHA